MTRLFPSPCSFRVRTFLALAATAVLAGCSDTGSAPEPGAGGSDVGGGSGTAGQGGRGGGNPGTGGTGAAAGTQNAGGSGASGGVVGGAAGSAAGVGGAAASGGMAMAGAGAGGFSSPGGASGAGTAGATSAGGASAGGASGAGGAASGGAAGGGAAGAGAGTDAGGMGGAAGSGPTIVGATPPMGWNSWNKYACDGLNETVVKKMADAFVSSGMKDAGYEYVNLDDCWMDGRDSATGKIKVNTSKFPSGIGALADYVHEKGLKLGIYSTPNTQTCAGIYGGYTGGVGSKDHETIDAQTWADWGIDYLKYDKCRGDLSRFAVMRDALEATGRPIFYSINPGDQGPYCTPTSCSINLLETANMWRIEFDISANWDAVIRLIDKNKPEYVGAGPGHWNDPDMLEVGNGLNDTEGRAHFSMWCIMAAPLITGNDLSAMSATTKAILTNREVIAVDQDPLGKQGHVVAGSGTNQEVWSKEMSGTNTRAVALFNRGTSNTSITVRWSDLGLPAGGATVRDLWQGRDLGSFTDQYTATGVAGHDVVMLKIVGGA